MPIFAILRWPLAFCLSASLFAQSWTLDTLWEQAGHDQAVRSAVGVTRQGTPIPAYLDSDDFDYDSPKTRILVVAGLDGSDESVRSAMNAWTWFRTSPYANDFTLSLIPVANPDAWLADSSGGDPTHGYPPTGDAYGSETDPEAHYLWRWIGMHAPDLVIVVRRGAQPRWSVRPSLLGLTQRISPSASRIEDDSLAAQLPIGMPSGVGSIPALQVEVSSPNDEFLESALNAWGQAPPGPSPARLEIRKRLQREPIEIARQLAAVYGHELDSVVYIPAVALIGRLTLGRLTGDDSQLADIERIVQPYLSGAKPTLPEKPTGSHLPGHLIFGELAQATGNKAYLDMARRAADLGFGADGAPLESMPFHNEMSDSLFMGCAILAQVGHLTGEGRYFDMALKHMRFMQSLDWRDDGLYRHSPLDEAAWGRGNGFPALGLALSLSYIPDGYPGRETMQAAYVRHMDALLPQQDPTGMWHQVIDRPESYRELTATSMIAFALTRGLRQGWISGESYEKAVERAWYGLKTRISPAGELVDVCQSTGKQSDLRSYYDRTAILGRDDRGGAMAMLAAVEIAQWEKTR